MNTNPHRAGGGAARAAVFFLAVWLIAAAISAVPVVLQVRGYVQAAEAAGTDQGSPDSEPGQSGTPTQGSTPSEAPAAPAPSAPAAPAPSTQQDATVAMTVQHTCGSNGRGDCFLTVRSGPGSSNSAVRTYDEGDSLTGQCWVNGESVTPSATGVTTSKWVRLAGGGYVTGGYVSNLGQLQPC